MFRRILAIFKRDLVSNFREFMLIYILIAPMLLAVGLRFFIPSVNATGLTFALDAGIDQKIAQVFEKYGEVELYDSREQLETRVNDIDDVTGLTIDQQGHYQVLIEGNESENIMPLILRNMNSDDQAAVNFEFSDIGYALSPIASVGTVSVIITAIVLSGMLIGLGIIEDKEAGTIGALSVTPMSRGEYVAGKSLVGLFLALTHAYLTLWILGMMHVNLWMVLVITFISSFIALIFGFVMGVISANQMAGMATMKILFLPVSASIVGALFLPDRLQFLLYWSPIYWSYLGLYGIIVETATWGQIVYYSLWIVGLTAVTFLLFKNRIRRGLL